MLNIMKEKEKIVSKIFADTKKQLEEIISNEFQDFDKVNIICHADFDELELEKQGKKVKFRLTTKRYDSGKNQKKKEGLYFRKSMNSVLDFNEKEFKEIQRRLQALYEK